MPDLADAFPGYCSHCGGTHSGECGVKAATRSILANWRPRGATAGFDCPNPAVAFLGLGLRVSLRVSNLDTSP